MSGPTEDARSVCFTEQEAFLVVWALAEAEGNAAAAGALSDVAFLRPVIDMVFGRIQEERR